MRKWKAKNSPDESLNNGALEPSEIRKEIREQIHVFQSNGLPGLLNTDVFPVLYRTQIQKWHEMAAAHLQAVAGDTIIAATSIMSLVDQQCHVSPPALEGLIAIIQGLYKSAYDKAEKALQEYMEQEKDFALQTTNPEFERNIEALRLSRYQEASKNHMLILQDWLETKKPNTTTIMVQIDHMLRDLHFDATTRMENEVHDVLKVYYHVSLLAYNVNPNPSPTLIDVVAFASIVHRLFYQKGGGRLCFEQAGSTPRPIHRIHHRPVRGRGREASLRGRGSSFEAREV
jgi:hypothetical protein